MTRAIVLVDGEHYPPVTLEAIDALRARGLDVVAAVFLGGKEKLGGRLELGALPIVEAPSQREALARALDEFHPDVVFDISDAPVIDTRARMLLASVALARGVEYRGADFAFLVPPRPRLTTVPAVAVIGTGKRAGKTAVAAALARYARACGIAPVIVAMGRGGPSEPVVTRSAPSVEDLLAIADAGEHAATDAFEDAVVAGVTTVGARRAGGGLAGAPLYDTVARAVALAEAEEPDLIILEGSGTAIPPARADVTVLVVGGATPPVEIATGMGPYRLLISHLAIVTMAEEPALLRGTISALDSLISECARDVPVVRTVFRPAPVASVAGKKVMFATTAPETAGPALVAHLEQVHGAEVVAVTHDLSDRQRLSQDLARAEGKYEVLLTEVKAAAIDVAARAAVRSGARVVFCDNEPIGDGLDAAFASVLTGAGL